MMYSPRRILVAQTLFLGDVILSLPLIAELKLRFPEAEVDVLVNNETEGILNNHPSISSVIVFDASGNGGFSRLFALASRIRSRGYDTSIVFPGSIRTALVTYFADIPRRIGTNLTSGIELYYDRVSFPKESWNIRGGKIQKLASRLSDLSKKRFSLTSALFTEVVQFDPARHVLERHLQLLEPLGIRRQGSVTYERLYPSKEDEKNVEHLLERYNLVHDKLIAVAPGSRWNTKRWLKENYIDTIRRMTANRVNVVLIGGREDKELCADIREGVDSRSVINVSGTLSPLESAVLLKKCRVLLTNDSAAMHISAAVGTSCVVIMGPTVRDFGFVPRGQVHKIIEVGGVWCRPCTPFGGVTCPTGTFECMKRIEIDAVVHALMERCS